MLVRVGPRISGRTTWALELLRNNPHHMLLVRDESEAARLRAVFPDMKDSIYSWGNKDAINYARKPLIIDGAEMLIHRYFHPGARIEAVTIEGLAI